MSTLETINCRHPGCTSEARSDRGIYAYLCDYHIDVKRRTGVGSVSEKSPAAARPAGKISGDGFEAKIKELGRLGKRVDRARARAKAATEKALQEKAVADALEQSFRARTRELLGGDA